MTSRSATPAPDGCYGSSVAYQAVRPSTLRRRYRRGTAGEFFVVTSGSSSNPSTVRRVLVVSETRLQLLLGRRPLKPGEMMTADLAPATSVIMTDGLSESAAVTVELSWADRSEPLLITVPPS